MKKIVLIAIMMIGSTVSYAQSIFNTLEDMDGVSSVIVSKDAFEILSKFNPEGLEDNEAMEIFNMINELDQLKVFSTDDTVIANQMDKMVETAVKKFKLTELMRIKEDDSRVKIYVKAGKNKERVSEVLMFVKRNVGSVIVSLTGNIDINKISKLADAYDLKVSKN